MVRACSVKAYGRQAGRCVAVVRVGKGHAAIIMLVYILSATEEE